jgi:lipopolysaccharide/colanic/teichoic acid biosynthesis glycosyltransferase
MTNGHEFSSAVVAPVLDKPIAAQLPLAFPQANKPSLLSSKRWLDLAVAIPAFVITLPLMLLAMAAVWLSDPGTVVFRQRRIGHNGVPFMMLKVRTMYENNDDSAFRNYNTKELLGKASPTSSGLFRLEHDDRVIPVGRFLRRYAIDELPQLVNVIRGEMSVVGPRPLQPWEVELFTDEQRRRHDVPPGITGVWQVSGQNRLSIPQMLQLDLDYVDHHSISLDFTIILRTFPALVRDDTC